MTTVTRSELAALFREIADRIDAPAAKPQRRPKKAKTQPAPEPASGQVTDHGYDRELMLHRSWLNHFCKLGGKEWRGEGPDPLAPNHKIRREVIAEYRDKLEAISWSRAHPEPEPV